MRSFIRSTVGLGVIGLFFVAALNDDQPFGSVSFLLIFFGALLAAQISRPKPVGIDDGRTRRDIVLPAYVENLMFGRWMVLVCGVALTAATKSPILWGFTIAAFVLMTEYASRKYQREDPVAWEIAFHNDVDGYESGDGDGGGDGE